MYTGSVFEKHNCLPINQQHALFWLDFVLPSHTTLQHLFYQKGWLVEA